MQIGIRNGIFDFFCIFHHQLLSFLVDSTTDLLVLYQEIVSKLLLILKIKRGSGDLKFYITFKSNINN